MGISNSRAPQVGPQLSIVIPCFDEAVRLPAFLDSVIAFVQSEDPGVEVLVVDDGSGDRTAEVAFARRADLPTLRVLRCHVNAGKGAAVRTGLLAAGGARRLFVDADGATAITALPEFEAAIEAGVDLAIGSRELAGAQVEATALRRFLGRSFNRVVRAGVVRDLRDTQCGFKVLTGPALDLLPYLREDGFAFDVELLFLAQLRGVSVGEVAVDWTEVPGSKVSLFRDGVSMLRAIRRIRRRAARGDYDRVAPPPRAYDEL